MRWLDKVLMVDSTVSVSCPTAEWGAPWLNGRAEPYLQRADEGEQLARKCRACLRPVPHLRPPNNTNTLTLRTLLCGQRAPTLVPHLTM
eukprot:782211-Pyramimonas_sp.AAC.1